MVERALARRPQLKDLLAYGELQRKDERGVLDTGSEFALEQRDRYWARISIVCFVFFLPFFYVAKGIWVTKRCSRRLARCESWPLALGGRFMLVWYLGKDELYQP